MRILAFSDMHGSHKAFKMLKKKASKVDLIINCGDFTIFGNDQIRLMKKLDKLGKPMLLIHGNHETRTTLEKDCRKFKNLIFVHKKAKIIKNLLILGHGGGGFSLKDKEFDKKVVPKFKEKIKKAKKKDLKVIFMSHAPPYKTKADLIMDEHCGSKSYRDFILKNKINYNFCGHLHETFGAMDKIKKCFVVNPGPGGMMFEV